MMPKSRQGLRARVSQARAGGAGWRLRRVRVRTERTRRSSADLWFAPVVMISAVYVAPDVAAVRGLWDRSGSRAGRVIGAQLSAFADALIASRAARERAAEVLVGNWLDAPRWRSQGRQTGDKPAATGALSLQRARLIVARDHGFASWSIVGGECDPAFERAVDAIVLGRIEQLDRLLADFPDLIRRRSAYGHRATLLHYTAANGVEIRRQVVPANAAEITARLLDAGADPAARFHAYGGTPDTLTMLKSSAHPRAAGVAEDIERALAIH
jgi:hypothetical protein